MRSDRRQRGRRPTGSASRTFSPTRGFAPWPQRPRASRRRPTIAALYWPFDSWLGWGGLRAVGRAAEAERVRTGVLSPSSGSGTRPRLLPSRCRGKSSRSRRPIGCKPGRLARAGRSSTGGTDAVRRRRGLTGPRRPPIAPKRRRQTRRLDPSCRPQSAARAPWERGGARSTAPQPGAQSRNSPWPTSASGPVAGLDDMTRADAPDLDQLSGQGSQVRQRVRVEGAVEHRAGTGSAAGRHRHHRRTPQLAAVLHPGRRSKHLDERVLYGVFGQ